VTIATHSYLLLTLALILTAVLLQRPFRTPRRPGATTILRRTRRSGAPAGADGSDLAAAPGPGGPRPQTATTDGSRGVEPLPADGARTGLVAPPPH
jgi:hypothetical protein